MYEAHEAWPTPRLFRGPRMPCFTMGMILKHGSCHMIPTQEHATVLIEHCFSGNTSGAGAVVLKSRVIGQQDHLNIFRIRMVGIRVSNIPMHYCSGGIAIGHYNTGGYPGRHHFEVFHDYCDFGFEYENYMKVSRLLLGRFYITHDIPLLPPNTLGLNVDVVCGEDTNLPLSLAGSTHCPPCRIQDDVSGHWLALDDEVRSFLKHKCVWPRGYGSPKSLKTDLIKYGVPNCDNWINNSTMNYFLTSHDERRLLWKPVNCMYQVPATNFSRNLCLIKRHFCFFGGSHTRFMHNYFVLFMAGRNETKAAKHNVEYSNFASYTMDYHGTFLVSHWEKYVNR